MNWLVAAVKDESILIFDEPRRTNNTRELWGG